MTGDPSNDDLKSLWLDQTPETDPVTLEQIHALAGRFERRSRSAIFIAMAAAAAGLFFTGLEWTTLPDPLLRTGLALMAAGWLLYLVTIYRLFHPRRDLAEAAAPFLRRRMKRALRNAQGGWILLAAPLIPGLAVTTAGLLRGAHGFRWGQWAPLIAIAAIWIVVFLVRARRRVHRAKQEIDELDVLLKA